MSTSEPIYIDGPVTLDQLEAGAWARVEHVAIALAVDERTIRRRVRAGHLERGTFAGRAYVRQASRPAPQAAPDTVSALSAASAHQLEALLAATVREHVERVERVALELGQARAQLAHVQARAAELDASAARAAAEQAAADARREALERELATERQRAEQAADAARLVNEELERERQRRNRLEELARAPWYAVRVRRRIRRELATGTQ